MFTAALLTVAKRWKQPKHPSGDGWIHSMGSIHTVEYDSSMKSSEALTQATVWRDLEHMMFRERSQTQKDTVCDSIYRKRPEQANPWRQIVD